MLMLLRRDLKKYVQGSWNYFELGKEKTWDLVAVLNKILEGECGRNCSMLHQFPPTTSLTVSVSSGMTVLPGKKIIFSNAILAKSSEI